MSTVVALATLGLGLAFALSRGWRRGEEPRAAAESRVEQAALHRAAAVFDGTDQGIMVTDAKRRIVAVNQAFTRLTGYSALEVLGRNRALLQSGRHDEAFYERMGAALDECGQWQGEIWDRRKNGDVFPGWENISAIRGVDGQVRGSASIGVALYPDDGDCAEALTEAADAAMYRAKRFGRYGHAFYS